MEVICNNKNPWKVGRGPAYNELCRVKRIIPYAYTNELGVLSIVRFYELYDYEFPANTFTGRSIYSELNFDVVLDEYELRQEIKDLHIVTLNSKKLLKQEAGLDFFEYVFYCPGCKSMHGFRTKDWPMPVGLNEMYQKLFANKWTWNGDLYRPTVTPKFEVNRLVEGYDVNGNKVDSVMYEKFCRFYVKEGLLIYLGDCKHELKSLQIEMLDI